MQETNETMTNEQETEMNKADETLTNEQETEMNKADETLTNETTTKENDMNTETSNTRFSIDPEGYGFKFQTKNGEYGANFHMGDENNWGITFSTPNKTNANLDFEGGEGTVSYTNAEGKQSEKFNFTSARQWLQRFGIEVNDEAEEAAAEAEQAEAQAEEQELVAEA